MSHQKELKRIVFIVNPISGTDDKADIIDFIRALFKPSTGYSLEIYYTKSHGDAFVIASKFRNLGFDIVVAVGGDGTVNEVAKALVSGKTKLGIIPVGSGNGLARHLGISLNYKTAMAVILREKFLSIDAGCINNELFFCTAGIGFDAVVGNRFNKSKHRGFPMYIAFSVQEYMVYKPEKYRLEIQGNIYDREAFLITIANAAQWGNNVYIAPHSDITDGMFDVVVWKKSSMLTMPFLAGGLLTKTLHLSEYVDTFKCKEVTIYRKSEGLIQYDGESSIMGDVLKASIIKKAVKVIIP